MAELTPEQIARLEDKRDKYQLIVDSIDSKMAEVSIVSRADNDNDEIETKDNEDILKSRAHYSSLIAKINLRLSGNDGLGICVTKNNTWGTF